MISLLDVNVLLALLSPRHEFFPQASGWFGAHHREGWATCPISQAGFVRLHSQRLITGMEITAQEAIRVLERNCVPSMNHAFWPHESSVADLLPEIRRRLIGHKQLTDAILLDLAIRKGARFVTLDRLVRRLLPVDSPHQSAIEVIPTA